MGVTREYLSLAPNGNLIQVVQTSSAGTPLHVATNTPGEGDEMALYGFNNHNVLVTVTIEWGLAGAANEIKVDLEPKTGPIPLVPGLTLKDGQTIAAYATVASVVNIGGTVNRITP